MCNKDKWIKLITKKASADLIFIFIETYETADIQPGEVLGNSRLGELKGIPGILGVHNAVGDKSCDQEDWYRRYYRIEPAGTVVPLLVLQM